MEQEYGANYISITDEEGVEYELEILASVQYKGAEYLALTAADQDEDAEDLEVSILKSVLESGEPVLVAVEDEAELETVYDLLMEQLFDEDDGEEKE